MTNPQNRTLIALCGWPDSGKSTVQRLLVERYGATEVDDGFPFRDFGIRHVGLSHEDVYTQEGKATERLMPGGLVMENRKFLGELAKAVEAILGPDAVTEMAIMRCRGAGTFVFGSCRRQQGRAYRKHGGHVIEVRRPGFGPNKNDFDAFDPQWITGAIDNDGGTAELERKVADYFDPILLKTAA